MLYLPCCTLLYPINLRGEFYHVLSCGFPGLPSYHVFLLHLFFPMEITWMICPPSQRGVTIDPSQATQDLFEFSNGLQWIFFGSEAGLHH